MPIIVFSSQDEAGKNIARQLVAKGFRKAAPAGSQLGPLECWEKDGIRMFQVPVRLSRDCDRLAANPIFSTDLVVFASRHRSESGKPCLTVHATGNFGTGTEHGGNPGELARASAKALHCAFGFLQAHKVEGFDPYIEATHHGPTSLPAPSLFVEVGSTENEWKLEEPARAVADAIMETCLQQLAGYPNEANPVAIGFGGTHYAAKFSKNSDKYAFSHIAPKHALEAVDAAMVRQMVEKTAEKVACAVLDWKGTTLPQRERLFAAFKELGMQWKRV